MEKTNKKLLLVGTKKPARKTKGMGSIIRIILVNIIARGRWRALISTVEEVKTRGW